MIQGRRILSLITWSVYFFLRWLMQLSNERTSTSRIWTSPRKKDIGWYNHPHRRNSILPSLSQRSHRTKSIYSWDFKPPSYVRLHTRHLPPKRADFVIFDLASPLLDSKRFLSPLKVHSNDIVTDWAHSDSGSMSTEVLGIVEENEIWDLKKMNSSVQESNSFIQQIVRARDV